jgi:hypothetical protein
MALPDISIKKRNGGLGRQKPTEDGITGLVTQGLAVPGKLDLGKVYELRSLLAAEALGIVASAPAYAKVHHQISEFYRLSPGAILLLMVVGYDVSMAEMADRTQPYAKKMLMAQNGRIKQLGFYLNPAAGYAPTYEGGLDADVLATVAKAQALADEEFKQHRPLWCAVAGHGLADDLSTAADLTTKLAPLVSVVVATDALLQPGEPALGALLGMVSAAPVHICIGYVGGCQLAGDGSFLAAGLANGTANEDLLPGELAGLHDKGYIVALQHPGADGLFFSDSPTCVGKESDYCQIENVRTVNKAAALIRRALLPQLKGPLLLNEDGTLQPQVLGDLEERGAQALTVGMARPGEISALDVYINPETVLSSSSENAPLTVDFSVVPMGVSRNIEASIGLVTTL